MVDQSQQDGYNHLYLFDLSQGMMHPIETYGPTKLMIPYTQITQGEWLVQEILGFKEKTQEVIIMSTEQSPLQSNAYAVSLKDGKRHLLWRFY